MGFVPHKAVGTEDRGDSGQDRAGVPHLGPHLGALHRTPVPGLHLGQHSVPTGYSSSLHRGWDRMHWG
jgi:hypothetical protein